MIKEKVIDYERTKKVVKALDDYFAGREDLARVEYPLNIEFGSSKYLLYMFYSCLLDYGMRSKVYHKNLIESYKKYPDIFNPFYVVKMEENVLKDIIVNNIHPRYPNVASKKWVELSKVLIEYDDILDYLKSFNSFKELEDFIRNIGGFGQKTGGLLIRTICEAMVCNFKEDMESIPIDRHDIDISYLTGVIEDKKLSNGDIAKLSSTYVTIGKESKVNPGDIDKYLWEIGNSFCNKKRCDECPLKDFCKSK